ncbi:chemotaxis protein CheB [Daejeonella sp.]|uniref:chemotaxis protein CheB n=1 Tax=Daejeonella sp. TaxID=2805397 RepID=UPI003983940D
MKAEEVVSKRVIVVGTSAGGLRALTKLVSQLQADFPVPILVVQHISADATGNVLLDSLRKNSQLICGNATNKGLMKPGHLYLAPSDHHLMISDDKSLLVTKGAHENRSRPAIDPLFRSAAVTFGTGVIGILLTGYLNDGTSGMEAIKRCGGICIVQDPEDADYPDMPKNALSNVKVDYTLPLAQIGGVIHKLLFAKVKKQVPIPIDIRTEASIAKRVLSDLPSVNSLGNLVPFNCPGCGGVLWEIKTDNGLRYRCHTGHAYTASTLLAEQTMKIEETMWTALRMFEERRNLLLTLARDQNGANAKSSIERADASQVHIDRIKAILHSNEKAAERDIPV